MSSLSDERSPGQGGAIVEQQAGGAAATLAPATDTGTDAAPRVEVTRDGTSRQVISRTAYARRNTCQATWADSWSLAHAATHARAHGHVVSASYACTYVYGRPVTP